jgi:hypothetical protein
LLFLAVEMILRISGQALQFRANGGGIRLCCQVSQCGQRPYHRLVLEQRRLFIDTLLTYEAGTSD